MPVDDSHAAATQRVDDPIRTHPVSGREVGGGGIEQLLDVSGIEGLEEVGGGFVAGEQPFHLAADSFVLGGRGDQARAPGRGGVQRRSE
ncbi:MAG: hypothetical protein ACREK5_03715 [Gemmatimonadota bacterium]